jgi:hypothetical protein
VIVLLPSDPLRPDAPDPAFAREATAAEAAGLRWTLVDHDAAARGDVDAATAPVRARGPVVYRGWMLRAERWAALHEALVARGCAPLTTPEAYRAAHHLPGWYATLEGLTPRSVWLPASGDVVAAARAFGDAALVVKDFVKSEKHLWREACFVPRASDEGALLRVVRRFLAERGPDLEGGLVLREHVALDLLGTHPRSGMPLAVETRAFILDGSPAYVLPYWEGTGDRVPPPPLERFLPALRRVPARFITADLARRADGEWLILEVGDGQVSGVPEDQDALPLFRALAALMAP